MIGVSMQDIFYNYINCGDLVLYSKNDKPHIAEVYDVKEDHIVAKTVVCELDYNDRRKKVEPRWRVQQNGALRKIYNTDGVRFLVLSEAPAEVLVLLGGL